MRTDQEIVDRMKAVQKVDFFGVRQEELLCRLPFERARPFLKEEVISTDWTSYIRNRDEKTIQAEMLSYLSFAWDKANNRRGLSVARSLDYMNSWLWLLGRDEAAEQILSYTMYSKPELRAICEEFGWNWRQWDDGKWTSEESEEGSAPPETVPALAAHHEKVH